MSAPNSTLGGFVYHGRGLASIPSARQLGPPPDIQAALVLSRMALNTNLV